MKRPYDWAAGIVDTQIIKIGGVVVASLPGEFTTMSGRKVVYRVFHIQIGVAFSAKYSLRPDEHD